MVLNTTYTDKQTTEMISDYIGSHYEDLSKVSKSIVRGPLWEDLLHESIFSILNMKRLPEAIFMDEKEFLYIFVIMKRIYYSKQKPFKDKFGLSDLENNQIESNEEVYDFTKEVLYESVFKYTKQLVKEEIITDYDSKCFFLYHFPNKIDKIINIKKKDYQTLNKKPTYRTIEAITGINFQSIRYTAMYVLDIIKENIIKPSESEAMQLTDSFKFKKNIKTNEEISMSTL